ncbi:MAG: TROVE domain-containing protein, partial [Allosphingosinicella sp.]
MRLNIANFFRPRTFEGAPAVVPRTDLAALRRAVASCLLWEDQFYEDGIAIGDRIAELAARVDPAAVAALALEARTDMRLRHAPLWLLVALMKADTAGKVDVAGTVAETVRRADEMGELIALYWKDGRRPLPAAMKRGLARAFAKFDAYQLAKYDRKTAVTLKDVLRLTHPKPADEAQAAMWKQVVDGSLEPPDTWEVALSGGADKKETFERLLRENRLGYLALLRNLRNMSESGVDPDLVTAAILARKGAHNVLPFRYVAAARAAPQFEPALDEALSAAVEAMPVL